MDASYLVSVLQAAADGVMGAHFWPILALLVPIEDHLNVAACLGLTADLTVTIWLLLMHRVPKLRSPQLLSGTGQ